MKETSCSLCLVQILCPNPLDCVTRAQKTLGPEEAMLHCPEAGQRCWYWNCKVLVCTVRSGQWDLQTGVVKRSWSAPGAFLQGPEKLVMAQSRESEEDRGLLLLSYLFKFRFKPVKN